MKICPLLFTLAVGTLLTACQPRSIDWDGSGAAATQVMNRMEAQQIEREKHGDPAPKGYATWRAYWHSRLVTLEPNAWYPDQGSGSLGHITGQTAVFIRQERAKAGLPPVD